MKYTKKQGQTCPIYFIGTSAHPMVAFSGFLESHEPPPSGDAHDIVLSHRHGHQNGQQIGYIFNRCFVCCCPGGGRGNTEPVAAPWRLPGASGVALAMLHWAMSRALLQRVCMAIIMACNRGTFACHHRLFCLA